MSYFLQQAANAVPLASLYAALAFAYALAFGVTRRADFTHGALFAFGGQLFVLFTAWVWYALWLVLPAALALGAAIALAYAAGTGWLAARFVIRPLAAARRDAITAASLGLMIVLMEAARLAADARLIWLAPFLNQRVRLFDLNAGPVTLTLVQLLGAGFLTGLVAAGALILGRCRAGRIWRALRDDPLAAQMLGVNSGRALVATYTLAATLSAVIGIVAASWWGTMDIGDSLVFGLKAVFVAAIGGPASPLLAAFGGALIGFAEMLWSAYAPAAWRDPAIFSLMVFVLVTRTRPVASGI